MTFISDKNTPPPPPPAEGLLPISVLHSITLLIFLPIQTLLAIVQNFHLPIIIVKTLSHNETTHTPPTSLPIGSYLHLLLPQPPPLLLHLRLFQL